MREIDLSERPEQAQVSNASSNIFWGLTMSTIGAIQHHKDGRKFASRARRDGRDLGRWVVRTRPALKQRCLSAKIDHTPHLCLLCALTPIKRSETNQMSRPRPPRPRLASRTRRPDDTKLHPNPPTTSRDPKTRFRAKPHFPRALPAGKEGDSFLASQKLRDKSREYAAGVPCCLLTLGHSGHVFCVCR